MRVYNLSRYSTYTPDRTILNWRKYHLVCASFVIYESTSINFASEEFKNKWKASTYDVLRYFSTYSLLTKYVDDILSYVVYVNLRKSNIFSNVFIQQLRSKVFEIVISLIYVLHFNSLSFLRDKYITNTRSSAQKFLRRNFCNILIFQYSRDFYNAKKKKKT